MLFNKKILNDTTKAILFCAIILVIFCVLILPLHDARMFNSVDGSYMRDLINEQHTWMSPFYLGMNILQGTGDIFIAVMTQLDPAFIIGRYFHQVSLMPVVIYTIVSVQYMLGAYLLCRIFKLLPTPSLISSLVITLFAMPLLPTYNGVSLLYPIFDMIPWLVNLLFCSILLLFIFQKIGKYSITVSIFLSLCAIILTLYLALISTVNIILIAPFIGLVCLTEIIFSPTKKEQVFKIIVIIILLLTLMMLRYFTYLYGLFSYTVAHLLPHTLQLPPEQLANTSLLLIYPLSHNFPVSSWIAAAGLLSSIRLLFLATTRDTKRYAAIFTLYSLCIVTVGVSTVIFPGWYHGPATLYFGFIIWPLYMGYTFAFLFQLYNVFKGNRKTPKILQGPYCITLLLLVVAFSYNWLYKDPQSVYHYPPKKTTLVKYLINQIALIPGHPFNGYAATFSPTPTSKGISWFDQTVFDAQLIAQLGNDLRFIGLWHYHIPTLFEYSQILAPSLYSLLTKTMARKIDTQMRNVIVLTQPNFALLEALGVRYIITSKRYHYADAIQHQSPTYYSNTKTPIYLYELTHYNHASFHPTHFHIITSESQFVDRVNHSTVDFSKEVFVNQTVKSSHFVKPLYTHLTAIKGGVELQAASNHRSTVLLPLLYSHCLHIEFLGKKPSFFKLLRANMTQTLVIFSNRIDVKITYRFGLMHYADCRAADTKDFNHLIPILQQETQQPVADHFPLMPDKKQQVA